MGKLTIRQVLRQSSLHLEQAGADTPQLDARLLLQHAAELSHEELLLRENDTVEAEVRHRYNALIERRAAREPLSQILGVREFWGREFAVTSDVLTPRPDSETLIEAVLEVVGDRQAAMKILDIGVGSGCLLLTLLAELPASTGVGLDKSPQALKVAEANARQLGVANRADFRRSDWCSALNGEKFEIIVANPPYIPSNALESLMPEVVAHEPGLALDGGKDGLDAYRALAACIPEHLFSDTHIAVELGASQRQTVEEIFVVQGFNPVTCKRDLAGIERVIIFKHQK